MKPIESGLFRAEMRLSLALLLAAASATTAATITPPRPSIVGAGLRRAIAPPVAPVLQRKQQRPIHVKVSGRWYDVTAWAAKHPGGRYVLEWADGYDITGAFHTIHLFGSRSATDILARMPTANLTARTQPLAEFPAIDSAPASEQARTGMDTFMERGERVIQLSSPPVTLGQASAMPPVAAARGLAWQADGVGGRSEPTVGDSAIKRELEELLHRHFDSPAAYKATPEHWLRIAGAFALFAVCFAGWARGSLPETLLLPFAQWLLFSPTVHESSHSTLSTNPWVNYAASFCGLPYIYNPFIWWPQHILSHHQYTNDDACARPAPPLAPGPPHPTRAHTGTWHPSRSARLSRHAHIVGAKRSSPCPSILPSTPSHTRSRTRSHRSPALACPRAASMLISTTFALRGCTRGWRQRRAPPDSISSSRCATHVRRRVLLPPRGSPPTTPSHHTLSHLASQHAFPPHTIPPCLPARLPTTPLSPRLPTTPHSPRLPTTPLSPRLPRSARAQGYFSTIGMAVLWPLRNVQGGSTGRWYANLITPKPDAVAMAPFLLSVLPVAFVLTWPWLLVVASLLSGGEYGVSILHGAMLWLYPWMVSGAIWTVRAPPQPPCARPADGPGPLPWSMWASYAAEVRTILTRCAASPPVPWSTGDDSGVARAGGLPATADG